MDSVIKTYGKCEDEYFEEEADIAFTFPTKNELKEEAGMNSEIAVFLFKQQKTQCLLISIV
ncbi:hypothetical protein THRCLA_23312 [Thraustotheca clavata]|uniref:Uncharacterized protein n=1 Tax=Thraustotheca clavata TaxID=74557 RepID=A0A1V9Y7J6_9STRA|nr:hypothetical protein THRCLA_23312 [Thraustotheca clavata]